ncbi:hypothetical protein SAMN04487910_2933 [Aquimarina amphilecti]|uniref:Membrane domain of glycerophosphoryl diester phosphodiesterase n=1 Tax=Aquimarina amphilecti TaxID=1038014 RepID=A0A1H7RZ53_AQUAM|nr:hypothetical protein [Aquimarina amphilecti]SEL65522.1 hypothetical protein SAMN04487910_2933 [Aquimarina amphilecti]
MNSNQLFEKIENSNPVDFGNIFNKSIELFKKVWLQGFIHLLISVVVLIPLIIVMYIPIFAIAGLAGLENSYGDYGYVQEDLSLGMLILFVILVVIISMVASAFQLAITAHFYRVCKQVDMGVPETTNYFMFFKGKYLGKIFTLAIATFGIALLAASLCYLPLFYVIVPLQLLGAIFAFNPDIGTSDLIKASFKFGNKVWLVAFGLIFISSILSQIVGMVLCFIGIFFTASFVYLPIYYLYKDGVGFENENESEGWSALVE